MIHANLDLLAGSQTAPERDELLAILAHELRQPLAPLHYTLLRFENASGDAPVALSASTLAMLARQVRQLTRLIDDVADYSALARGRLALRREQVMLSDVVDQAVEMVQPAVVRAGVRLVVDSEPALSLYADRERLVQVLGNLLLNAIHHSPAGSVIELLATRDPGGLRIEVRDQGQGIERERLERIFDLYVTRDSSRGHHGCGIGLALVRQLVELHGGAVHAHSDGVGRGSCFIVRLPLTAAPLGPRPVAGLLRDVAGHSRS